ncbi:Leo1-domain-containing protein [Hanseniaspora valbyensis NRRL Y-1626]|uniref:Leo1-domain-containing protein n=1 Tax=Hanseniaspora valbyensis NRRL Y-1626 TaxID=766949 RepID=A0A1B7TGF5_9ASCO|nr:Leo1-domain-containing protein [Hanseniaspora valbyensis NRRL Y-1626]
MSDIDTTGSNAELEKHETEEVTNNNPSTEVEKEQQHEEEEEVDMDDLFGEESDEDENNDNDKEAEEEDEERNGEEEEENAEDSETEYQDEIKIAEAELPKHIIPYKVDLNESKTMQSRLPPFLKVDPKNFDPQQFLQKFNDRLNDPNLDTNDKINMSLFDESTIRWRYTKDPKTGLITKESNATIVEWDDGSMSLKIGDEYCDIITNELECSLLVKTYPKANLLQTIGDSGIVKEKCMFVPATMKSNLHKRLAKAVQAQTSKENEKMGPKTVYIGKDPALELEKLEKEQDAIARAKRREELKELKRKEREFERKMESGNAGEKTYKRKYKQTYDDDGFDRIGMDEDEEEEDEEEYDEEDDFVVNDDDEIEEGEEEEEEEEEDEEDDDSKDDRLSKAKTELAFKEEEEEEDDDEQVVKKRKIVIEDDEE